MPCRWSAGAPPGEKKSIGHLRDIWGASGDDLQMPGRCPGDSIPFDLRHSRRIQAAPWPQVRWSGGFLLKRWPPSTSAELWLPGGRRGKCDWGIIWEQTWKWRGRAHNVATSTAINSWQRPGKRRLFCLPSFIRSYQCWELAARVCVFSFSWHVM